MPNRVYAAVDPVQASTAHPAGDGGVAEPFVTELRPGDDPALPLRQPSDPKCRHLPAALYACPTANPTSATTRPPTVTCSSDVGSATAMKRLRMTAIATSSTATTT